MLHRVLFPLGSNDQRSNCLFTTVPLLMEYIRLSLSFLCLIYCSVASSRHFIFPPPVGKFPTSFSFPYTFWFQLIQSMHLELSSLVTKSQIPILNEQSNTTSRKKRHTISKAWFRKRTTCIFFGTSIARLVLWLLNSRVVRPTETWEVLCLL